MWYNYADMGKSWDDVEAYFEAYFRPRSPRTKPGLQGIYYRLRKAIPRGAWRAASRGAPLPLMYKSLAYMTRQERNTWRWIHPAHRLSSETLVENSSL